MRKEIFWTVEAEGRDKGKVFYIKEKPSLQAEKWALKAFLAIARSGVEVPPEVQAMGMAGLAVVGLRALSGISFADAEPLMDDMLSCVQAVPTPSNRSMMRPLIEDDIEEIATLLALRAEIWTLHTGFSFADIRSELTRKSAAAEHHHKA